MQKNNRFLAFATASVLGFTALNAAAAGIWVLNNNDAGAGSFREAIALANADASVTWIKFAPGLEPVALQNSVEYSGAQALSIDGQDATLTAASGPDVFDLFVASGGGPLDVKCLSIAGGPANGLLVAVPPTAAEEVQVALYQVTLADNAGSGLLIDDMLGSPAGVSLSAQQCIVSGNGTIASDVDAVRVNERGAGSITANIKDCLFEANANDALEFDEAGPGDISVQVLHSKFLANGFLDPADLEDGLDCDEADEGDVVASLIDCQFLYNGDDGGDLNEAGPGSLYASFTQVTSIGHGDKGLKVEEIGEGSVYLTYTQVTVNDSGDKAISAKEADEGSVYAALNQIIAIDNGKEGIKFDETGLGDMEVQLNNGYLAGNGDDGMQVEEKDAGNLFLRVVDSTIADSVKFGLNVPQGDGGEGLLRLQHVTFIDNASGAYKAKGVKVIEVGVPK